MMGRPESRRQPARRPAPRMGDKRRLAFLAIAESAIGARSKGRRRQMHFDVLGPVSGPGIQIYATFVRAVGRGSRADAARLAESLTVALPGRDITIDLREVEELGPDGIAALVQTSERVRSWDSGLLYLLATAGGPVLKELESSELARHPRVYIEEVGTRQP